MSEPVKSELPSVAVAEYATIAAGILNSPNSPFIVRQCAEFSATAIEAAFEVESDAGCIVYGYRKRDEACAEVTEGLELRQLWADYKRGTLEFKILDSPMLHMTPDLLPRSMYDYRDSARPSLILSPVGTTNLHLDPPDYGGGFMYLCHGEKDWSFMDPFQTIPNVYDAANRRLFDRTAGVPCSNARMSGGDFIYFPPGELHRVITTQPSFGLGGYLLLDACANRRERVLQFIKGYDITGIYG